MKLNDISSAKHIGKLLKSSREEHRVNLQHISNQCDLSIYQLTHIEEGNLFAFEKSFKKFWECSAIYATALGIDINTSNETQEFSPISENKVLDSKKIPAFLLKK